MKSFASNKENTTWIVCMHKTGNRNNSRRHIDEFSDDFRWIVHAAYPEVSLFDRWLMGKPAERSPRISNLLISCLCLETSVNDILSVENFSLVWFENVPSLTLAMCVLAFSPLSPSHFLSPSSSSSACSPVRLMYSHHTNISRPVFLSVYRLSQFSFATNYFIRSADDHYHVFSLSLSPSTSPFYLIQIFGTSHDIVPSIFKLRLTFHRWQRRQ